jgi:hypothetical protein
MLFRAFRILRALNRGYGLGVFWLFVCAFPPSFLLIFIMPPAALLVVFLALALLLLAVAAGKLLRLAERGMARALLDRGVCPGCAARGRAGAAAGWECDACGVNFLGNGVEQEMELRGA